MIKEPAKKSYWFGRSYKDLFNTIRGSFESNFDMIKDLSERIKDCITNFHVMSVLRILLYSLIIVFLSLFGFLFTAVLSVFHITIIAIIMAFVYVGFMLLWFCDAVYRKIHQISYNCPSCQQKFKMPAYVCPNCHKRHYRLIPSKYGIFYRTCECGQKLPTTFLNGRQKLDAVCPHCDESLIKGITRAYLIPVIGGANCGKTCFINSAIQELEKDSSSYGLSFQYKPKQDGGVDEYSENKERMSQGYVPEKTSDMRMKYYNFILNKKGDAIDNQISVCDIAGESFESEENTQNQQGFRFCDGIVIVVDPFSIEEFDNKAKEEMKEEEYQSVNRSTQSIEETFNVTNNAIEHILHKSDGLKKLVAAIVFVKTDIPYVDEKVGEKAIEERRKNDPSLSYLEASNCVASDFFKEYGLNSTLLEIQGKFSKVQFFSVSALGKEQKVGSAFVSINADKPLYWILNEVTNIHVQDALTVK